MFKINLDSLLVLDAVDRLGSLAAAANELFKVPSTISYTVNKLEQDLGVRIYERQGPKVILTKAGFELLTEGRHLIRAAEELEKRVKRVALGWETDITIGLDTMFSPSTLLPYMHDFYQITETRVKIIHESLSGTWEALLDRRADLLVGAAGDGPSGGGYHKELLGMTSFIFCVSPLHPLASLDKPIEKNDLAPYRAIVVSDSARHSAPRTVGLLSGQNTLAVPNMQTKIDYQIAGIGFGFLPEALAQEAIQQNLLIVKGVQEPRTPEPIYLAWRSGEASEGEALQWWINRLKSSDIYEKLWRDITTPI